MSDEAGQVVAIAKELLGEDVISVEYLKGGRNNRVCQIISATGTRYIAKFYAQPGPGGRDRLQAEHMALRFLWENGVRCIPRPLAAEAALNCAFYEFVAGEKVPPEAIGSADVEAVAHFLAILKRLTGRTGSEKLPSAAEACFSSATIVETVNARLSRLVAAQTDASIDRSLDSFLKVDFLPALNAATERCRAGQGARYEELLPVAHRSLSPSDLGFHNTLRRGDGQLVFLDFEYFGWDDPAKAICDFVLHPAMTLSESLRQSFVALTAPGFADDPYLHERVSLHYPLWTLKWCLILLNEFLPENWRRRQFAGSGASDHSTVLQTQLAKAQRMLQRMVVTDGGQFPYDL